MHFVLGNRYPVGKNATHRVLGLAIFHSEGAGCQGRQTLHRGEHRLEGLPGLPTPCPVARLLDGINRQKVPARSCGAGKEGDGRIKQPHTSRAKFTSPGQ